LGIFFFTTASRTALEPTQPPIQWVSGALSLGIKRPGREPDHSPHLVPRSKNEWSYTSTPQYAFMAWCSVKAQDNFTFTFRERIRIILITYHCVSTCCMSAVITMSEQVIPLAVAHRIIVKFITKENVKPAEILIRLRVKFGNEIISRTRVYDWSKSFDEGRTKVENV
jgi:hypothetical protein